MRCSGRSGTRWRRGAPGWAEMGVKDVGKRLSARELVEMIGERRSSSVVGGDEQQQREQLPDK